MHVISCNAEQNLSSTIVHRNKKTGCLEIRETHGKNDLYTWFERQVKY